jgi:predicted nucleic acid-binding protein
MNAGFADTAFYVAAASPRDALHQAALEFVARYPGRTVTTDFVLIEVATFLVKDDTRQAFAQLVVGLRSSRKTQIVPASRDLFDRGLALSNRGPIKSGRLPIARRSL